VQQLIAGRDFIWQELLIDSPAGPIELYELKFLRDGQVTLQLYGSKQGTVWQPGDLAGFVPPAGEAAEQVHHRYIDLQARQDADGLADSFFSEDARLVTAKLNLEGREALRTFFRSKFEKESGFHLVSTRNITGDHDYVWFEATAGGSQGVRTVYDVMLLRDGQVTLQLVGTLEGVLPANATAKE
jgi:ketosteroid isomerase-like protein